jgi:hypothetical protein
VRTAPWPGDEASRRELAEHCGGVLPWATGYPGLPDGVSLDAYVGPEDTWLAGRLLPCVLVRDDGGRTTTTLLH